MEANKEQQQPQEVTEEMMKTIPLSHLVWYQQGDKFKALNNLMLKQNTLERAIMELEHSDNRNALLDLSHLYWDDFRELITKISEKIQDEYNKIMEEKDNQE